MNHHSAYLETELRTATPQKMRHLLICGALRFARRTIDAWGEGNHEAGSEALVRCRAIITELMASVRPDASDTARMVLGLYLYLFRTLTEAHFHRDAARVADVIRVLEEEGETWRLVCEQLPEAPVDDSQAIAAREVTATGQPAILPPGASGRAASSASSLAGFDTDRLGGAPFPGAAPPAATGFQWNA